MLKEKEIIRKIKKEKNAIRNEQKQKNEDFESWLSRVDIAISDLEDICENNKNKKINTIDIINEKRNEIENTMIEACALFMIWLEDWRN